MEEYSTMDIKDRMEINKDALDEEWLDQPMFFFEVALSLSQAKERLIKANTALELEEAEIATDVRDNPENYGIAKITVDAVKEAVKMSDKRIFALGRVNKCKNEVDVLQVAVNALEHRKRALENLVTLHGQNYFASPSEKKGGGAEAMRAREEKRKQRVRSKRKG